MAAKQTAMRKDETLYFAMPVTSITFQTPAVIVAHTDEESFSERGQNGSVFIRRETKKLAPAAAKG